MYYRVVTTGNQLQAASLDWALRHLNFEGEGDLFPKPFETDLLGKSWSTVRPMLEKIDISSHTWSATRNVLVPKDEVSFRRASQLDPLDAVLFTGIIYEAGRVIESRRRPLSENRVFSYRFDPQNNGSMFALGNPWGGFWRSALKYSSTASHVVVLDISDFYNQIYHHTIENQLNESQVSRAHVSAILNLLSTASSGVSRGIPIGPHSSHVLAELSLIPLDDYLSLKGYNYWLFVDDIHIACTSHQQAQISIYDVAKFLDTSQKLLLNKQKTEILTSREYRARAKLMLVDNPINNEEKRILEILQRRAGPYTRVALSDLAPEDLKFLQGANIEGILKSYLEPGEPNYVRLRWFLRRLAQVGLPGGLEYIIANLQKCLPAIGEVAAYLNSAKELYRGAWADIGEALISSLKQPIVATNEYLQIVLLSMFSRITPLNHFHLLAQSFDIYGDAARREVLLAAAITPASTPWVQSIKTNFGLMDPWQRRALIFAAQRLPKDERRFWLKNLKTSLSPLEAVISGFVKDL